MSMVLPHRFVARNVHALSATSRSVARSSCNEVIRRPARSPLLIQTRTKRSSVTSKKNNSKKATISRAIASNQANSSSTSTSTGAADAAGGEVEVTVAELAAAVGLRPVDYSVLPPVRMSPPPPPTKPGLQKYLWPALVLFTAGTVGYFYVNNKNDNYEYWRAMQSGEALQLDDDDDEEEEEDDEEYEEEKDEGEKNLVKIEEGRDQLPARGGDGAIDAEPVTRKRGWLGWIRGWRRAEDKAPSGG